MGTVYIYSLIDPRTDRVNYIGKAKNPYIRLRRHIAEQGKTDRHEWIRNCANWDLFPECESLSKYPMKYGKSVSNSGLPIIRIWAVNWLI